MYENLATMDKTNRKFWIKTLLYFQYFFLYKVMSYFRILFYNQMNNNNKPNLITEGI